MDMKGDLMSYEDRYAKISARILKEELGELKKKAKGMTIAEYIRLKLFGRKPIVPTGDPVQDE